jgi:hypothetical protein
MVGVARIELATPAMSTRAATPKILIYNLFFTQRSAILPPQTGARGDSRFM